MQSQVRFSREKVWEALVQSQLKSNRVPEKVPEKVPEALVQSQVRFNKVPEKVLEKVWEALVQSQVRFNRLPEKVPEKVPGKVWGGFGAEPGQVQHGSGEGSGECLGGFGGEAFMQGQVRFNGICSHFTTETQLMCFQRLASQHASERFVKIKRCGCWGYRRISLTSWVCPHCKVVLMSRRMIP